MDLDVTVYTLVFWLSVLTSILVISAHYWIYIIVLLTVYLAYHIYRVKTTTRVEIKRKGVLITGCDTGFGHSLTKRLADTGFTVYAGVLSKEGEGATVIRRWQYRNVHVIKLDVTKEEDVIKAMAYINNKNTGLWGVVSNAGVNFPGDIELTTIDQFKKVADVNLYGGIRVVKSCLPLIRASKGRVVFISSARGLYSWPGEAAYIITKHGLEVFADTLRLEMVKFGVSVSVVQPGDFDGATSIMSPSQLTRIKSEIDYMWTCASPDVKQTYSEFYMENLYQSKASKMKDITRFTDDPITGAIEDALVNHNPKTRCLVGGSSGLIDIVFALFYNILPEILTDKFVMVWTKCHQWPKEQKNK